MTIRLYRPPRADSPKFEAVAVTYAASQIAYKQRFYTFGDFEFTLPHDAEYADAFEKYLLVHINGEFWGIILAVEKNFDSGGNMLTVSGLDLKGLMYSRFTLPPAFSDTATDGTAGYDAVQGTTEYCMKHFVRSNFFAEASPTRAMPGFVVAPDLGRGLADDKYMTRHDLLSDVLAELGEAAELGYAVTPDLGAGAIVFDCIEGVNRSAEQYENPRMIFSPERGNILSMRYQNNDRSMRNVFYATLSGAQFADEAFTATYTRGDAPLPEGIYRWEQHLDISATHPEAGREYEELKRLALVRAESYITAESLTADVLDKAATEAVYSLGDIVTVQNRAWGMTMNPRITEIAVSADGGGVTRTLTFGKAPINPLARIRRQIRGG